MPRDRSATLPAEIEVSFRPLACNGTAWDKVPSGWSATSELSAAAGALGLAGDEEGTEGWTLGFRDTALAAYTAPAGVLVGPMKTPPVDAAALRALADRIALDWWSWHLVAFDLAYNGIVAPQLDGYTDEVTWSWTADECSTRVESGPWDDDPDQLNHGNPATDCPNCVGIYADGATAAVGAGPVVLPKANLCLELDRLYLLPDGDDSLFLCCDKPCEYSVIVLSAVDGSTPIDGAAVSIHLGDGVTHYSGETGAGQPFTASGLPPTGPDMVTISMGGCKYTGPIECNTPLILYYCTGSATYSSNGPDPVYWASALDQVVSMTGGSPLYGPTYWTSPSPGTAVFCWFRTTRPYVNADGCAVIGSVGRYDLGFDGTSFGTGACHDGDGSYWDTCDTGGEVCCGTNTTYLYRYWEKATWNAAPCGACAPAQCVDAANALPKTLCSVVSGPGTGGAGDNTLTWDPTSWDGGCTNFGLPMRYTSGCMAGNGEGGVCVSTDPDTGVQTLGRKVPYGSYRVDLAITCSSIGSVRYRNFWAAGCPQFDPCTAVCDGFDGPECPSSGAAYCPEPIYSEQDNSLIGYNYRFYPMELDFTLRNEPGGGFSGCLPVAWANGSFPGDSFRDSCVVDGAAFVATSSCAITDCGGGGGGYYSSPMVMMSVVRPYLAAPVPAPPPSSKRKRWRGN